MTFSFIHAADIHLGRPFSNIPNTQTCKNAVEKAFKNFIDYALVKNVDFVLIAGDTFDSDEQDFESKLILKEGLNKLAAADIKVFLICGNHDPISSYNKTTFNYDENSNIKIVGLNSNTYEDFIATDKNNNPVAIIHALSFKDSVLKENPTKYFSQADKNLFNIGLLHCDLDGSKESPYAPCSKGDLDTLNYDYWALGHIHIPSEKYAGTIQGRNTKETGAHGIKHIKVENGTVVKNQFVNTDVIRFEDIEIDLSNTTEITNAATEIQETIQQKIDTNCDLLYIRINLIGFVEYYNEVNSDFYEIISEKIKNESNEKIYVSEIKNNLISKINENNLNEDEGISGKLYKIIQDKNNIKNAFIKTENQLKQLLQHCNFEEDEYQNFIKEIEKEAEETCKNLCAQIYNNESKEELNG